MIPDQENLRLRAYRRWAERRDRIRKQMAEALRETDLMLRGELEAYDEDGVPPLTPEEEFAREGIRLRDYKFR